MDQAVRLGVTDKGWRRRIEVAELANVGFAYLRFAPTAAVHATAV
jgi:hypothetical protein